MVALVGENGSGKTTLAKILAGLYRPESGTVCWDQTDIGDMDQESLREQIAVMFTLQASQYGASRYGR